MGYVRHNAIVVTSWSEGLIAEAAEVASAKGLRVLGPSDKATNMYRSMLVCPDGSKEGWEESDANDQRRKEFRQWLRDKAHEDGSTSLEWVEISYGNDDVGAEIIATAWPVE